MALGSFWKAKHPPSVTQKEDPTAVAGSAYAAEYFAALDRTERFGFEAPSRLLVRKDCVDMSRVLPVLLDYFEAHGWEALIGQTAAIHFALVALLADKTRIPYQLTIGWIERHGKPIFQHDDTLIQRFVDEGTGAWLSLGCPFHLWLTSPAAEILDITFAMNLGWAKTREQCRALIVYQPGDEVVRDPVYHPTVVGPDFFQKTGGVV
jgi:hypothetical protein